MVIYTMTRKQILRIIAAVLGAITVALLIVFAVAGSVTASADTGRKPVCSVERGDNRIALTFNCAWGDSDTDRLLEILSAAGAKATFFVTGEFCTEHPAAVRSMSAAGHSVQNLTDTNIHIKGMNINDLIADTKSAAAKIKTLTGIEPALHRAPFADYDDKTLTTLEGMGITPVQWSVDSRDLDDPDAFSVRKRILDSTASGSILLFHNDSPAAVEALPELLTELKQKGFEFVRAEELVYSDSFTIDEKGVQHQTIQTVLPVVYSDENGALDSAFEKMRVNLTLQEIYDLSSVGRVGLIDKIKSFLNEQELYAVREATYEELTDCYLVLVYAAERYGAGGTYADPQYDTTDLPQIQQAEEDNTDVGNDTAAEDDEEIPVIPEDPEQQDMMPEKDAAPDNDPQTSVK